MAQKIKIAIDAMGGDQSPKKIIEGIEISLKKNQEKLFFLYVINYSMFCRNCKNKLTLKIVNIGSQPISSVFYSKSIMSCSEFLYLKV